LAVVAINIDPVLYDRVAKRVLDGSYLDFDQFFDLAARNQLALEATSNPALLAPRSMDDPRAVTEKATGPNKPATSLDGAPADVRPSSGLQRQLGELLRRAALTIERFPRPDVDPNVDRLLWGQTNRLLPIAAGVRVLAHMLRDSDDVPATTWYQQATGVATALRDDLRMRDENAKRPHGSRWATAFPDKKESSVQRYVNQFLGVAARDGRSEGGAVFLGLVSITGRPGDEARVTLTTSGASWAGLANPIFDGDGEGDRTFSDEEVRFFLNHLHEFRIGEYRFLNTLAMLVAEGMTRDQQNEAIARAYPRWASVASTMRAGGIGRLGDLGLLERTRRGLNVHYRLSQLAESLGLPQRSEVVGVD
jgi:hypothetical protein